ncbi:hypothetical protein AOQ72_04120 [Bradyrhizobium yuanmingense]|uniref:Uncharacterized protein n=1 Tax=Bradyrhizobium yuanmingense TaxID=108015 RepID=A0A0R3BNB1_9BRAD|nr:hypothetical protein [Bradyrhizobium yuanmingense]KRP85836.1 hypothetical protein AOQ72_04120 [Bradyrhizobium yuanmingense]
MQLDLLKQKTADYALTLAGLQMAQSNLTPAQTYQLELQKIQASVRCGKTERRSVCAGHREFG